MIGYNVDVTKLTREQAYNYIMNRCKECERNMSCTGKEAYACNDKVSYLVNKYKQ